MNDRTMQAMREAMLSYASCITRHASRLASIAAAITLATACETPPKIPDYSAAWPEVAESTSGTSGAIFQSGHDVALFENSTARHIGDTVTIKLAEETNASKTSTTATKKATTVGITAPTGLGANATIKGSPIAVGLDNNNTFAGSGSAAQSNKLDGQLTVTVAKRLANGNLLVRGQKWLTLNQGSEFVRIQGVIRPVDIDPDNSIPSYKVADATISYGGQGALADANSPGLLSRFFNLKWLPF